MKVFWTRVQFSPAPPLTNLFELFELLDRYQSEMIDFFTKNKSDKFGFISYDDMKKIELKLNV